jgi:hypothetical protein
MDLAQAAYGWRDIEALAAACAPVLAEMKTS